MLRPRPAPPNVLVVELSTYENFSKIISPCSSGIPMPVSVTLN
jgi:hypothetical protein